jgi:iron complex transport system substrate-binding protein
MDLEAITELDPDLILAANLHITEVVPALEELGFTVVVIDPPDLMSVLDGIELVAYVTDQEGVADELLAEMRARIDAVTAAVEGLEKPRTFWELSNDLWTSGPGSFVDDLINRAGGMNVAAEADSQWVQLDNESVVAADPEVIFLADHPFGESKETLSERPGWSELSALQEGRVVEIIDTDMFSRPGPRVVDALELAAFALHPDAFECELYLDSEAISTDIDC